MTETDGRCDLLALALERGFEMQGVDVILDPSRFQPDLSQTVVTGRSAAFYGGAKELRLLLKHDIDCTEEWFDGTNPLHIARSPDKIRLLAEHGCLVNAVGASDMVHPDMGVVNAFTPMHMRIADLEDEAYRIYNLRSECGDVAPKYPPVVEPVAELLAAGADPAALSGDGETPLELLQRKRCPAPPGFEEALQEGGADRVRCLQLLFDLCPVPGLQARRLVHPRVAAVLRHRRAHEAQRDAGLVFRAAAEGRPLELGKRLRLGRLAGGLDVLGVAEGPGGERVEVGPVEAARLGGHEECVRALEWASLGLGRGGM